MNYLCPKAKTYDLLFYSFPEAESLKGHLKSQGISEDIAERASKVFAGKVNTGKFSIEGDVTILLKTMKKSESNLFHALITPNFMTSTKQITFCNCNQKTRSNL